MPEAFRAWRQLEADAGQNLYLRTGGVSISPAGVDYVEMVANSLEAIGVPHRRMTGAQLNRAIPVFGVADDADVVFEPDAGMLAAARIVRTQVELAKEFGHGKTVVIEGWAVRRIDLEAERPTLVTDGGTIEADRLVVTAGAWTSRLVPDWPVPLRPTRQQVLYFRPDDPVAFRPGRFPVFIYKGRDEPDAFYGMPEFDGLGVKVARHSGPETDPDRPDPVVDDGYKAVVRGFLRGCIPALAGAAIDFTEVCLYNVAPDDQFQVGSPAGRPDVVVASPCSGHGFKFACLVGRVLADLAAHGFTDVDIDPWRVATA
jgi:sarcosine oxidase